MGRPRSLWIVNADDFGQITTWHCIIPVLAWFSMAVYNTCLTYSDKRIAVIRQRNQIQLLLDLLFVTVVIHFSGCVVTWFRTMYMILTLEAALIMDQDSYTYAIALGGTLEYGDFSRSSSTPGACPEFLFPRFSGGV